MIYIYIYIYIYSVEHEKVKKLYIIGKIDGHEHHKLKETINNAQGCKHKRVKLVPKGWN